MALTINHWRGIAHELVRDNPGIGLENFTEQLLSRSTDKTRDGEPEPVLVWNMGPKPISEFFEIVKDDVAKGIVNENVGKDSWKELNRVNTR